MECLDIQKMILHPLSFSALLFLIQLDKLFIYLFEEEKVTFFVGKFLELQLLCFFSIILSDEEDVRGLSHHTENPDNVLSEVASD